MRLVALALAASAVIISGCQNKYDVRGYWSSRTINLENIAAAEDEFADFALLASKAPEKDAFAAVDMLLKKAGKDEVAYLVYSEWIIRGFSSISSPCRNCPIFVHAADRILSQGILSDFEADEYRRRREFCLHNQIGDRAEIPLLSDEIVQFPGRTLFLVLDQDCPSCRESMLKFDSDKWAGTSLVALCCGHGPLPDTPGWKCYRFIHEQEIIDTRQTPFFFVISPDGTIEKSYTPVYDEYVL